MQDGDTDGDMRWNPYLWGGRSVSTSEGTYIDLIDAKKKS
jgi:hypothetical protein